MGSEKDFRRAGRRKKERETRTGSGVAEIAGFIEWLKASPKA
jgi:hypothetical protein